MKKYKNKEIEMKHILEPPHQLRMEIDEEEINELAQSIKQHGLINPITIQEDEEGRLIIIAGHRRFLAAKKIKLEKIPARIITNTTETEVKVIAAIENLQRVEMKIVEEADLVSNLHYEGELSTGEIADMLNRSKDWVLKRIELKQYPYEVLQALHEGSLKIGAARLIATIQEEGFRKWVLTQAVLAGATVSMIQTWINDSEIKASSEEAQELIQKFSDRTAEHFETTKFTCELCYQEDSLIHVMIIRICKTCCLQINSAKERYHYEQRQAEGTAKKDNENLKEKEGE